MYPTLQQVELLPLAARAAQQDFTAEFTNYCFRGALIQVRVTGGANTPNVTPKLQYTLDGENWNTWFQASSAITSTSAGVYEYLIYPVTSDDQVSDPAPPNLKDRFEYSLLGRNLRLVM